MSLCIHIKLGYTGPSFPVQSLFGLLCVRGTISKGAARRLQWFDYYNRCRNARKTCRYFGISVQTFYRWKRRFDPYDLTTIMV
ncbi:MAG: helix-turn-helix domain-containing protein [Candidatus Aminicenantes bacterium]|nr:helix-turn-helix domain-containing protein [Candidatus Aminicenantes bacterium]